eukprot:CAMPEP_0113440504 /NCGR_PEP_ID=MMETSP0014_2-20120614/593_1 /TAXON_ID=2857 /ORGANISM="Nitzschia sp." /LENGTH=621 /DNA_ID=CAMNT_0000331303 /DNA_START=63 /DNA_END=1930 /DNA_ORIENTATION=+ /assembly_acc=CAM_ASM_000159
MMSPWRQIQLLVAVSACYSIATTSTGTSSSTMVDAFSLSPAPTSAASSSPSSTLSMSFLSSMDDLTFETPDVVSAGIEEQACIDAASKMKRMAVPVPADVSPNGSVGISYIHWPAETSPLKKKMPPLILLHGFDSSGLEYRRLGPKLAAAGVDTYAVDVLGGDIPKSMNLAGDAASKMKRMAVPVPADVSPNGSVGISYIHWPAETSPLKKKMPPLILLHGFDSSGLEYRRLGPKLAAAGVDTYAVDVLGGDIPKSMNLAGDAASKMKRMAVPVPADVSPNGSVGISYIHWPAETSPLKKKMPPLILLHGFDSSGLEYRRLGPKLAAAGVDTYAVDVLGWGYTQIDEPGQSFSAQSKITALQSFAETLLKNNRSSDKFCVAGASLGGAAAIELAYASKESCAGLVLIDAQGFVDGVGPMALLPTPLAKAGVAFLKSVPLRNSANQMSYYDVDTYATEEAQMIGRLHCLRPGWSDAMVNFMQSGGFKPSSKVSQITSPSLVLWGREDGILDGAEFANKFVETLPDADLTWIEECGHVPHLEQPDRTCSAIVDFLSSKKVTLAVDGTYMTPLVGAAVAGGGADATSSTSEEQEEGDEAGPSPYVVGGGFLGALFLEEVIKTLF